MKTHYSCAELAALRLPGYPGTERAWRSLVEREAWPFNEVKSRGRGGVRREYLPPIVVTKLIAQRQAIASDGRAAAAVQAIKAQVLREVEGERAAKTEAAYADVWATLSVKGKAKFDAHFDILLAWRNWFAEQNAQGKVGRNEGFERFVASYNAGRIAVKEEVKARYTTISSRTLQRWVLANEKKGLVTFADRRTLKGRGHKSTIEQHPELEKALIAVITEKAHIDSTHLTEVLNHARIDRDTGEVLWPEISYDSVCRYRRKFEVNNAQALLAATNPDAWKSKYLSSLGKLDGDITRLNQRWEMDGTPADWELIDGRHTASVVIDVWSRRPRILFSKTPKTETNKALLRQCILDWGVLELAKTDNGSDYVSREMVLFFEEMGVVHERSAPFSPWEKGHVESFIKTYLHSLLELLDAFIGHNVAERQAIEAKRTFAEQLFKKNAVVKVDMTVAELQALTDAWLEGTYMVRKHSSLGMSPFEKVASWNGPVRRIENERALDILLAKPAKRMPTISAKGIRYDSHDYIHPELPIHAGKLADIRLDPSDLGRLVVYVDDEFLCIAECPELTGINRAEVAAHGRAIQKKFIAEKRAEYRAAKRSLPMSTQDLVKDLLMERARKAGKLSTLPQRVEVHTSPALASAAHAARVLDKGWDEPNAGLPPELAAFAARRNATAATTVTEPAQEQPAAPAPEPKVAQLRKDRTQFPPETNYREWKALEALVLDGMPIADEADRRWFVGYQQTAQYKAMQKRFEPERANASAQGVPAR